MITKNGYKMFGVRMTDWNLSAGSFDPRVALVTTSGTSITTVIPGQNQDDKIHYLMNTYASKVTNKGVVFGTGSTPVTLDDYTISGDYIPNLTMNVQQRYGRLDDDGYVIGAKYLITNNNKESVTIKEIAVNVNTFQNSASANGVVMAERTVLASPVTIPSGEIGTITYEIKLKYPTA